jgi:hypothetical protein
MTKRLLLAALLALTGVSARAAETAAFLDIGAGARYLALGSAGAALAGDVNALYWNPAGLASVDEREASASHAELSQTVRHDFLAYAQPTSVGTFAGGFTYLSQSAIEGRDALGHPAADFHAADAAVSLAFARQTDLADFGGTLKAVQSHIGSAQAETVAFDLGARKRLDAWTLGAALRNAGPGLKYDAQRNDLPLRLELGAAYKISGRHTLTAQWSNGPRGSGNDFGFGGEYAAVAGVALRAGYTTRSSLAGGSGFDAARGLTLGVGFSRKEWALDYAAVPMGELGASHRFTLSWRW